MINQYAKLQSMLFSYNNNALIIGNRKATAQSLVPQMALAWSQLDNELQSSILKKNYSHSVRVAENFVHLRTIIAEMRLSKAVQFEIAKQTNNRK